MMEHMDRLVISSYNSTGLSDSRKETIKDMLISENVDLLMLQETWLLSSQINSLSSLHPDYMAHGVSGMCDRTELISGRPYGGVGILWHRSLAAHVKPVGCNNKRLCAVTMTLGYLKLLLVNVYLPCDNHLQMTVEPEYQDALDDILCMWLESDANTLIVGGDFNTDPRRHNAHTAALINFVSAVDCDFMWSCVKQPLLDTYVSYDGRGRACLDHFILPLAYASLVSNVRVIDNVLNASNHLPIMMHLNVNDIIRTKPQPCESPTHAIAWGRITPDHITDYKAYVSNELQQLQVPNDVSNCVSLSCQDERHRYEIDRYCMILCDICVKAADECFPISRPNKINRPRWRDEMQPFKDDALFWDAIWRSCSCPRQGVVYELRQRTKRQYHYAFRRYKKQEQTLRRERMGEQILQSDQRQFWREVKRLFPSNVNNAPIIDGEANHGSIANIFADKYKALFNSVPSSPTDMASISSELNKLIEKTTAADAIVSTDEVSAAIKRLNANKHDGSREIWSDFFIWAPYPLINHLSSLFSAMLIHGYSPKSINLATVFPIPKDGDRCCSDNYRGIALSSCMAKLMEIILMSKSKSSIATSDLQFAYKKGHGTSMCTLLMKETINFYLNRGSEVYGCLIDASKAFDRLRHDKLLGTLLKRKVPVAVIRFLYQSYSNQKMQIRWCSQVSDSFGISNGVKQGGIFSPILFCMYMDVLLERLQSLGVGCHLGSTFTGALSYADDLTLISPCPYALKSMLRICEDFAKEYDITFNPKKSQCIFFSRDRNPPKSPTEISLCGKQLKWFHEVKHLGNTVKFDLNESPEIQKKGGDFIYHVNSLKAHFAHIQHDVLVKLFSTYCSSFYGSQAWNLSDPALKSLYTKFNRGIRLLFKLPFQTHTALLPLLLHSQPLINQLACRFNRMLSKMRNSQNSTIRNAIKLCLADPLSLTSCNMQIHRNVNLNSLPTSDQTKASASLILEIINSNFSSDFLTKDEIMFIFNTLCVT